MRRSRPPSKESQLEAELEAEHARLLAAQAVAKIGSWETNLATSQVTWSLETHRIFETDPALFIPTHAEFLSRVHPDDRAAVDAAIQRSGTHAAPQSIEHRIVSGEGVTKFVEERWQISRDASGTPVTAIGTCQDITERRALEQQFLRSQRMESVGTLAGGIAHDLNNVLTPILLAMELLRERMTHEDDLALLATLEESANRGADLVRQVMAFARGVDGERKAVDAAALLRDLVKGVRNMFPKSIAVTFEAPPDLWMINGDRTQIHQVALNLMVNARDAMPDGGTLSVRLVNTSLDEAYSAMNPDARPGRYVVLTVADTGAGIPPSVRDRIFEPFFTTKELGRSTGLGLSTSLGIVKSHAGFITFSSQLGTGTAFEVYLPALHAPEPAVDSPAPALPTGHNERILVVDDEPAIRAVAERILTRFGYRVLLASNGAEGVSMYALHSHDIALVLTDMAMPVMDGAAMILAIRTLSPTARIIACSGLTSHTETEAAGADVNAFVPKPYTADALLTAIRKVLGDSW